LGKRFLLEWCCTEIANTAIDPRGPFLDFLQDGVLLTKLITKYCTVDGINPNDLQVVDKSTLVRVLKAAEDRLGIPRAILSSSGILDNDTFDEYAVVIYMAVLRRMICAMKGEEPVKGGIKPEPSPSKPRSQTPNADNSQNYSPSKFPHNTKTSLTNSPLSPKSLRNLVDQHTKSHAAIQALQEHIQAVTNQGASTPRLQKKLPESLLIKDMAPAPTEGMSTSSPATHGGVTNEATENFPIAVIPTDHNDNFLAVNGEELFVLPPTDDKRSEELYSSVDKEFLELMLDAVQKGFMPPELATAKTWLSENATEVDLKGSGPLPNGELPSAVINTNATNDKALGKDDEVPSSLASVRPISAVDGPSLESADPLRLTEKSSSDSAEPKSIADDQSTRIGPSLAIVDPSLVSTGTPLTTVSPSSQLQTVVGKSDGLAAAEPFSDTVESAASTPNKKVQFLGLDTVFGDRSNAEDEPFDISISPGHVANEAPENELIDSGQILQSSPKTTVTWATLDSPVRKLRPPPSDTVRGVPCPAAGLYRFETALYGNESDDVSEGEGDDPFMMYLNAIEQTALKFKLQVEQAKVDTLETLKEKLERAYEGTPLEEIPLKFREKLQDTIAEIASDEVLKKYQALVSQDEQMSDEENAILECMRNELDSVACENFELHQQLTLLKDYEKRYFDLKEKFDDLNDGMTTIRNEYEKKNGESQFLAERVESLEKSIVNLRVEYNNEIRDLQNENLQLQRSCFELESKNKVLEEEMAANSEGSSDSHEEENVREKERRSNHKFVADQEFEVLQLRLEESERQNNALRAASQADQAMIQCVEDKKEELEKALVKAQDDHSNVLLELHEAQRQISSDRVKLSSYQEEVDALRRENKLLKSSLEIAQNELDYHVEKNGEKNAPWKSNKRMIWREIRELEKILKDVHREKRNLEKKYVTFKQGNDQLNGSLSFHSYSSAEDSPEREGNKDERERLKSKSWHSTTEMENGKALVNNAVGENGDSFSSPPLKVKSWLDGLHTPNGLVKSDVSYDLDVKERTPVLPERPLSATSDTSPRKDENGFRNELDELRHHVGSLEAEKAAIVKELSSLRFSRLTR